MTALTTKARNPVMVATSKDLLVANLAMIDHSGQWRSPPPPGILEKIVNDGVIDDAIKKNPLIFYVSNYPSNGVLTHKKQLRLRRALFTFSISFFVAHSKV